MITPRLAAVTIVVVTSALTSNIASAQGHARSLEEVIVTAQKREGSLQDTPIALDAFDESALEREGIANVGDLANNIPSLTIQPFPINTTTLRIYIRGIGLIDAQLTQDPPVGIYIDGAYIARSAALATDIADLQRIEVLRGPQGTLYGRNSTGGAVNLITRRPNTEALEFKQTLTTGDRDLFSSKTMLNTPLWDGAATKFAYYRSRVDGYIENTGEGGDFGDSSTAGYRFDFRWNVSDSLRLDYAYDRTTVENTNMTYSHIRPSTQIPNPSANDDIAFTNLVNSGARQFFDYNPEERRPTKIHSAVPIQAAENVVFGQQLALDWSLSDTLSVKYIYADRELYDKTPTNLASGARTDGFRLDNDAFTSFAVAANSGEAPVCTPCVGRNTYYDGYQPVVQQSQFSHEFQFMGTIADGSISYIAGLYYFEEEASERSGEDVEMGHLFSGPLGSVENGDNTGQRIEVLLQYNSEIKNTAMAAYTELSWVPPILDEKLSVTFGARHSEDNRKVLGSGRQVTFISIPGGGDNRSTSPLDIGIQLSDESGANSGDKDFSDDSFNLIFEYEAAEDVNVYFKRADAYKSGGFNSREPQDEAGQQRFRDGFEAEKVTAYELGVKSRLYENRIQINADIFHQTIVGQQLNFSVPNTLNNTTVANGDKSLLQGFEIDTTWVATDNLVLTANYAYLDATIDPSRNPISGEIEDGFVFDSAPKQAYTAALDWTLWQGDYGDRVAFNATYSFTDERNGGARAEHSSYTFDRQDDFAVLNVRLGAYELSVLDGSLDVAIWSKNLLDEEYSVNNVHTLPQSQRSMMFGAPRSVGLDIIYSWGG